MAKNVELIANLKVINDFGKFVKEFKKEIIEDGLDDILVESVIEVKEQLRFAVNEQILTQPASVDSNAKNELGQPEVNIPKSENEILKFLTNGKADITKYNRSKDYGTLSESGLIFGHPSKGQPRANRITLRMDIAPEENVSSQLAKAKTFFQDAIFGLPDLGGDIRYYANPGIDLGEYVKIKCSTQTGDSNTEPDYGMSPNRRFERDRNRRGFADWTLKQDAVDKIRNSFIDLTEVIEHIKVGDVDTARKLLVRQDRNNKLQTMKSQLDNIESKENLTPSMTAYTNSITLINNMKLSKKVDQDGTTYDLVSQYPDFPDKEVKFLDKIMESIRSWGVQAQEVWFQKLVKKVENLIKKFEDSGN